jgi:hypothetical protein
MDTITEKKLNRLAEVLKIANSDNVQFDEFVQYLEIIIDLVKRSQVFNEQEKEGFRQLFLEKSNTIEAQNSKAWAAVMKKVDSLKDGEDGENGTSPIADIDYPSLRTVKNWIKDSIKDIKIPDPIKPKELKAEEIVGMINESKTKINLEMVDGVEVLKELPEIKRMVQNQAAVPPTTTHIFKNGGLLGRAKNIDFVEGSNVTMSVVIKGDKAIVTINGEAGTPGGSFTEIAVSGTIDDTNVDFTSATEPTYLIINGIWYKSTGGAITWSYAGGNITLSVPVGTGGSIFGVA